MVNVDITHGASLTKLAHRRKTEKRFTNLVKLSEHSRNYSSDTYFPPQTLSGPRSGAIKVHERDAAGDQVQGAPQHHLQQPDQPQRPVTQQQSQELHATTITCNM